MFFEISYQKVQYKLQPADKAIVDFAVHSFAMQEGINFVLWHRLALWKSTVVFSCPVYCQFISIIKYVSSCFLPLEMNYALSIHA